MKSTKRINTEALMREQTIIVKGITAAIDYLGSRGTEINKSPIEVLGTGDWATMNTIAHRIADAKVAPEPLPKNLMLSFPTSRRVLRSINANFLCK